MTLINVPIGPAPAPAVVTAKFSTIFHPNFAWESKQRADAAPAYIADRALQVAAATQTRLSDVVTGSRSFDASFTGPEADAKTAVGLLTAYNARVQAWVSEPRLRIRRTD